MRATMQFECPCNRQCHDCEPHTISIFKQEKVLTSTELLNKLLAIGLRKRAARKRIAFLHHVDKRKKVNVFGCPKYIDVFRWPSSKNPLSPLAIVRFQGRIRIFHSKLATKKEIFAKIEPLLSDLQKEILKDLKDEIFGTYYLSSYEMRKLIPRKSDVVANALNRLEKLGLLERIRENSYYDFYASPEATDRLREKVRNARLQERAEYYIVEKVYEVIKRHRHEFGVNPFGGTKRPRKKKYLVLTRGMSYDIVLPSDDEIRKKPFLAVDIYTRFPLSKEIIGRFAKKLKMSRGAYGMILTRGNLINESLESYSNECNVVLGKLETFGIDYNNICKLFGIISDDSGKSK